MAWSGADSDTSLRMYWHWFLSWQLDYGEWQECFVRSFSKLDSENRTRYVSGKLESTPMEQSINIS